MIQKSMSEQEVKDALSAWFQPTAKSSNSSEYGSLIANSVTAYERKWKRQMPASTKTILKQSFEKMTQIFQNRDRMPREAILSAVSDVSKVDNPIALAYNLMSILIPNFAYTEVIGIQPIPTKESPVFYPQIIANEDRNNTKKGDVLLGSTNWHMSNNYTTNQVADTFDLDTDVAQSIMVSEGNTTPETLALQVTIEDTGTYVIFDDGKGLLVPVDGVTADPAGTVNYETGAVNFELDDFYQVKQVLNGYNIDQVLSSSVAGYINKEISGNGLQEG